MKHAHPEHAAVVPDMPTAAHLLGAVIASEGGDDAAADRILHPWTCCPNALAFWIVGSLQLARHLCRYAGQALVLTQRDTLHLPEGTSRQERERWASAYAIAEHLLAGENAQGIELLALTLRHDEGAAPVVLKLATSALAMSMAAPANPSLSDD